MVCLPCHGSNQWGRWYYILIRSIHRPDLIVCIVIIVGVYLQTGWVHIYLGIPENIIFNSNIWIKCPRPTKPPPLGIEVQNCINRLKEGVQWNIATTLPCHYLRDNRNNSYFQGTSISVLCPGTCTSFQIKWHCLHRWGYSTSNSLHPYPPTLSPPYLVQNRREGKIILSNKPANQSIVWMHL